jgi:hypothetical protein
MPKSRKVRAWVYLAASLLLALVLLALEIQVLALFVSPIHFDKTLYGIALYPLWALNAFPAGYILGLLGLRVYRSPPSKASTEIAQGGETPR